MTMLKIRPSGTRSARAAYAATCCPRPDPRATSARSRSPEEICAAPVSCVSHLPCVPFPAPGGDSMTTRTMVTAPLPARAGPACPVSLFLAPGAHLQLGPAGQPSQRRLGADRLGLAKGGAG